MKLLSIQRHREGVSKINITTIWDGKLYVTTGERTRYIEQSSSMTQWKENREWKGEERECVLEKG